MLLCLSTSGYIQTFAVTHTHDTLSARQPAYIVMYSLNSSDMLFVRSKGIDHNTMPGLASTIASRSVDGFSTTARFAGACRR